MLEEAGLEVPETMAEWTEVLQAFKDQGATKPYVSSNIEGLKAAFLGAYDVRNSMYVQYGTQDIAFGAQQDGYRDWLAQMNAWYEEGLLDPDIQTAMVRYNVTRFSWERQELPMEVVAETWAVGGQRQKANRKPMERTLVLSVLGSRY